MNHNFKLADNVDAVEKGPAEQAIENKELPRSERLALLKRTPFRTGGKFVFALSVIISGIVLIWDRTQIIGSGWIQFFSLPAIMVILGLIYAHFTELQHELLHGHGFKSNTINRVLGFICGLFTLSSYSHYKYHHLAHHRFLGTDRNSEFFAYPKRGLDGIGKLTLAALNPSRFLTVANRMWQSISGHLLEDVTDQDMAKQIRTEYTLYALIIMSCLIYSMVTFDFFFLIAWILPLVLIAEPTHFLIELPEHFGLDAHGTRDVRLNTRSIEAPAVIRWFTNGNNLHTAHHMMAGVPMERCKKLHDMSRDTFSTVETSYFSFYRKVISGEIRPYNEERSTLN